MANDDLKDLGAIDDLSDLGAIDIPPEEEPAGPGQLEAFTRGAAQSASFGLADELAAALSAGGEVAVDEQKQLSDLLNLYRKHRGESREAYARAAEEHPGTYLAGELGGALVPGAGLISGAAKGATVAAKLGQALKTGVGLGALTGFGQSEADIAAGEIGEATKDVATGAAVGAITGAAAIPLGAAAKTAVQHRFVYEPIEALKRGFRGQKLIGKEASELIEKEQSAATRSLIEDLSTASKEAAEQKRALLQEMEESGVTFDIGPKLRETETLLTELPQFTRQERADVRGLEDLLKNAYKKYGPELPEQKELMKQALEQNILPFDLETGKVNKEFKHFIEGYGKVLRSIEPSTVGPLQLEELRKSAATMTDLGDFGLKTPPAKKAALGLSQGLKQTLREHEIYGKPLELSDEAMSTYYSAQEILFGDKMTRNLTQDEMAKLQNAVKAKLLDLESKGKGGTKARELFGVAFEELEKVDPSLVKKHKERLTDIATAYDLNRAIESAGLGVGTTGRGMVLAKAHEAGQLGGEVVRGTVEPVKHMAQKAASWIKGSSSESLKDLANKMSNMATDAVPAGLKEKLALAAERKDEVARNAILYTLMQQPTYRQFLMGFMDTEE